MLHKGAIIAGSIASFFPWAGSLIYFIAPPLMIGGIEQLKSKRDCFVALKGQTTNNQLLACGWKTNNSNLNFYLYSVKPSPTVSLVKALEIKQLSEDLNNNDRDFSVQLLFGSKVDLKVYKWTLESARWVNQERKTFNLTGFCKSTSLSSFRDTRTRALTCKWGDGAEEQEIWPAFT